MVISGGENIYPAEVEAVLARHPAVADVAVIGRPDPGLGRGGARGDHPGRPGPAPPAEEIITWCRDRLAHFKCPKTVEFVGSLAPHHDRQGAQAGAAGPAAGTAGQLVTDAETRSGACRLQRSCRQPATGLGLSIASHSGLAPAAVGALAAAAEDAGFSAVFVAEGHGDALALCHPVAAATSRVRVGTAITNAALRPPVLAAKTAAQLDHATAGRFILGLGVANTVMNTRFGLQPVRAAADDRGVRAASCAQC